MRGTAFSLGAVAALLLAGAFGWKIAALATLGVGLAANLWEMRRRRA